MLQKNHIAKIKILVNFRYNTPHLSENQQQGVCREYSFAVLSSLLLLVILEYISKILEQ